ncbi:MAG: histidine phosphatase family protein [Microgenomates group bacterium]|nr:histidine phosphatase family protein [Microgenomates group bacterium]
MNNYCTFYIVRHGETDWNAKKLIQGQTDIPLNKKGETQAKELAKKLRRLKFSAVFSSDLLRAKKTAKIIALEKKLTVITKQVLRERDFGKLEGKSHVWLQTWRKLLRLGIDNLTDEEKKQLIKTHQGVESDESLMKRFIPFLRQVAIAYPRQNVLIVTHGSIIRTFLIHIGYFKDELDSLKSVIENSSYIKLISDGIDFFIKETKGINVVGFKTSSTSG